MFRRSMVGLVVLLSAATAGAAFAQSSAQPGAKAAAAPARSTAAKQDTTHKSTMHTAHAGQSSAKPAAKPTWTKDQIKEAQVGLTKAGLYKGDTSGVMNNATHKALKEYQKQHHLPVTGHLSDSTLAKLRTS